MDLTSGRRLMNMERKRKGHIILKLMRNRDLFILQLKEIIDFLQLTHEWYKLKSTIQFEYPDNLKDYEIFKY